MNKPLSMAMAELQNKLIQDVNEADVPMYLVEFIVNDLLKRVKEEAEKEVRYEHENYQRAQEALKETSEEEVQEFSEEEIQKEEVEADE